MKKNIYALVIILAALFVSCSGSDVYQGSWKATDGEGNKYELVFEAKSFVVKTADGTSTAYNYTQNSVKVKNSIKTYGIRLDDGRSFSIHFPIANDESKAVMLVGEDTHLYTMSRTDYIDYKDIYKLD